MLTWLQAPENFNTSVINVRKFNLGNVTQRNKPVFQASFVGCVYVASIERCWKVNKKQRSKKKKAGNAFRIANIKTTESSSLFRGLWVYSNSFQPLHLKYTSE